MEGRSGNHTVPVKSRERWRSRHQGVTFEGTAEGGGSSATISGTLELRDHDHRLLGDTTDDTGPIQVTGRA